MPDESCRNCGGILIEYAKCAQCNKTIQFICSSCNTRTVEQYHSFCIVGKSFRNNTMLTCKSEPSFLTSVA